MIVKTNNVPRDIVQAHELTLAEVVEFDYIDWEAVERGEQAPEFFRYKGTTYDLGEFSRANEIGSVQIPGKWDAFLSDSFFSGLAIRYVDGFERVVVALVTS